MQTFRCVCKTYAADLKRQGSKDGYAPRWNQTKRLCAVSFCITKKDRVNNCKLLSVSAIQEVLNDSCSSKDGQGSSDGVLLCQQHYNQVYRSIPGNHTKVQHRKCSVCSLNMKSMPLCWPRISETSDQGHSRSRNRPSLRECDLSSVLPVVSSHHEQSKEPRLQLKGPHHQYAEEWRSYAINWVRLLCAVLSYSHNSNDCNFSST